MIRWIIRINSVGMILVALFFLLYPPVRALLSIQDPAIRKPGIPKVAWRVYRNLTPRYATWARQRVADGRAATLSTTDISGTEWPLFGSVFYLWAIENLQAGWDEGDHSAGLEPRVFARDAIIAASELVVDPKHAAWVQKHWGQEYLHRENVFYRMLVIAALTAREKLLHDGFRLDLLRDQVETLSAELDSSKSGLLDDYPGECYPGDVMAALMCIKRADAILGTDHSEFIKRALRGFSGNRLTRHQLPPYAANSDTGLPVAGSRGCGNSYMCLTAPELWPAEAQRWFALYDRFFWQERVTAAGFREYPTNLPHSEWTMDVDAGPVIAGHGVAASAFGIGAARKNGRFDRAYPLTAEMLATAVELPNGVMVVPRLLSNLSDAPMLGEAALLFQLTVQPQPGFPVKTGGKVPPYVYIVLITMFLLGIWRILESIWAIKAIRREERVVPLSGFQIAVWICLLGGGTAGLLMHHQIAGTIVLVFALILPVKRKKKRPKGAEDWPGEKPAVSAPAESGPAKA